RFLRTAEGRDNVKASEHVEASTLEITPATRNGEKKDTHQQQETTRRRTVQLVPQLFMKLYDAGVKERDDGRSVETEDGGKCHDRWKKR
ncbi:hypothetical protein CBR_g88674, partial [Chara braunii]